MGFCRQNLIFLPPKNFIGFNLVGNTEMKIATDGVLTKNKLRWQTSVLVIKLFFVRMLGNEIEFSQILFNTHDTC